MIRAASAFSELLGISTDGECEVRLERSFISHLSWCIAGVIDMTALLVAIESAADTVISQTANKWS